MAEIALWRGRVPDSQQEADAQQDYARLAGLVRVSDGAIERMADYDMRKLTSLPDDGPYGSLRSEIRSALLAESERRLAAAVGGKER